MSEYRRFISYIYEYRKGRKEHNCGYARVQVRNGICRVRLHVQASHREPGQVAVYAFIRQAGAPVGILLGSAEGKNGIYEFQYSCPAGAVGGSGYTIGDVRGIWLRNGEDKNYITIWDDEPAEPARFREISGEDRPGEEETARGGETMQANAAEAEPSAAAQANAVGAKLSAAAQNDAEGAEPFAAEAKLSAATKNDAAKAEPFAAAQSNAAGAKLSSVVQNDAERRTESSAAAQANVSGAKLSSAVQNDAERAEPSAAEAKLSSAAQNNAAKAEPFATAQSNAAEAKLSAAGRNDAEGAEPSATMQADAAGAEPQERRQADGSLYLRWEQFQNHYPQIFPFADEEITQCIGIAPKDISFLQKEEWHFAKNTFVRQAYMQYHHLLLGCHKSGHFVLGVPGECRSMQDRHMAAMFDFPYFKERKQCFENGGEVRAADQRGSKEPSGYWYHFLNEGCPVKI